MRAFAGLGLSLDAARDETTILVFRHLLKRHELTGWCLRRAQHLKAQGSLLRGGMIVGCDPVAAPPSTKNTGQKRGPEMGRSKKGSQWDFDMKGLIGVDVRSGLVHTAGTVREAKVMEA